MESFIYSGLTKDRIPAAVCGFCAEGEKERILRLLGAMEQTVFGSYTAGYIIDYRLNEMIHTLLAEAKEKIAVLGATARVPGAEQETGGIFGNLSGRPFPSENPSEDIYGEENGFVYGARPGYAAFCVRGEAGDRLRKQFFSAEGKDGLTAFYHMLRESGREFLFISDGSGERAFGMAAVKGEAVTLEETVHRSCARRDFHGISRIGIFGGTFDPIHYGHLMAAETAKEALGLELVVFMPNGEVPYRREAVTDRWHRYEMIFRAVRENPGFCVSDLELERKGISFTADTVKELRSLCDGDAEITFLMGADVFPSLPRWKNFSELSALSRFAVLARPGYRFDEGVAGELRRSFQTEVIPVPSLFSPVSSSEIRERVSEGRSVRYLLPEQVRDFIELHRLYSKT